MKVLFLRDRHGDAGEIHKACLENAGHEVINPAIDVDDFFAAVQIAQSAYDHHHPDLIVGNSLGGAIAMNFNSGDTPMVLICPAWKQWGVARTVKQRSLILHSPADQVIPFNDSRELVSSSGITAATLIAIGHDHRLADDDSLGVLLWACNLLASGGLLPGIDDDDSQACLFSSSGNLASRNEGRYLCDSCGEEIVIPLDISEGSNQIYVEDCPVCCRANIIHVEFDKEGESQVWAEPE